MKENFDFPFGTHVHMTLLFLFRGQDAEVDSGWSPGLATPRHTKKTPTESGK